MMRQDLLVLVSAAIVLGGCDKEKPVVWKDYCVQQKRMIPPSERYRDVLLDILAKRGKYDAKFAGDGGVHFYAYYDRLKHAQSQLSDAEIASSYVSDYPQCCSQQKPTYLREKWDEADEAFWTVDVRVRRRLPPMSTGDTYFTDEFVRAVDGCDQHIRYRRGISGILE